MLPLLVFAMIMATQGYDLGTEMNSDTEICFNLRASRPPTEGVPPYHGPPESTDPSNFISFDVKRDNALEDVYDITIELDKDVSTDSLAGWSIQVREYGARDIPVGYAYGTVVEYTGISEGWNCPYDATNSTDIRNGVVHVNGPLNQGADISTITFKWTHRTTVSQVVPQCAKVVATLMTSNDNWWHAEESACFMHNDNGAITEVCPPECDSIKASKKNIMF